MSNIEFNTENKHKYENSIRSFVDQVDAQINFLQKKLENVEAAERQRFISKIEALKLKRDEFMNKVQFIKQSEENKWQETFREFDQKINDLSQEIQTAYDEIKDGFEYAVDKVKQDK